MQVDFDDLFLKTHISHRLEVLDDAATSFRSEHIFVIKATGRCRFFSRRFQWTGSDAVQEPDIVCDYDQWGHPQHRLQGPVIKEGSWFVWLIDLGRTLEAGQEDLIHLRHSLHNLEGTFQPHLMCGIKNGGVMNVNLTIALPQLLSQKVSYSETKRPSDQMLHTEILEPTQTNDSGQVLYQKNRDLDGTETNMNLRLDWQLGGKLNSAYTH